jgi:D-galactarolactone cycloisomerase
MKIKKILTFVATVPLGRQRFYSSQCAFPARNSMLVRVETDAGIVGWGEGGQYGPAEPVASCIEHVLAPRLLDRDPIERAVIWHDLYSATRDFGQKGAYIDAISAIDIALWDITGQMYGEPVYRLLGGSFRTSIPAYATGCYYRGDHYLDLGQAHSDLAAEARSYADSGFRMLKMKVGLLEVDKDLARVAAVREAVGPDCILLVDANHAYNATTAIRMARGLERYDVRWFEEPVPPEDRDGYRAVRHAGCVPVAGGECEYTRYGFRELLEGGCVDIAQPDICVAGGFSEWLKILAVAESFGIWVIPHVWGSGIAFAAALHALAALPPFPHTANPIPLQNEPVIEFDRNYNPLRDELLKETIGMVDGRVAVPNGAGLGIEVNEDVLQRYATRYEVAAGR